MGETASSEVVVVQPDDGESFWQPAPANGYAEVRVSHRRHPSIQSFATGIQVIAPGCYIREHVHPAQEELLFFFEGRGEAVIDGESHPLRAGTTIYVGAGRRHTFVNTDPELELKMCWVMLPGGSAASMTSSPASAGPAAPASRRPSRSRARRTLRRSKPRPCSPRSRESTLETRGLRTLSLTALLPRRSCERFVLTTSTQCEQDLFGLPDPQCPLAKCRGSMGGSHLTLASRMSPTFSQ